MNLALNSYNPAFMNDMLIEARKLQEDIHSVLSDNNGDQSQAVTAAEIQALRGKYPTYLLGRSDRQLEYNANFALDNTFGLC
jgi:hypothetical protein